MKFRRHWVRGIAVTILAACSGLFLFNVLGPQRQALASDVDQRTASYASTSFDAGTGGAAPLQAWQVNPPANGNPPVPVNDRQWLAAYGPQTVYMTFDQAPAPGPLWFVKSTDAGRTWSVPMMLSGAQTLS